MTKKPLPNSLLLNNSISMLIELLDLDHGEAFILSGDGPSLQRWRPEQSFPRPLTLDGQATALLGLANPRLYRLQTLPHPLDEIGKRWQALGLKSFLLVPLGPPADRVGCLLLGAKEDISIEPAVRQAVDTWAKLLGKRLGDRGSQPNAAPCGVEANEPSQPATTLNRNTHIERVRDRETTESRVRFQAQLLSHVQDSVIAADLEGQIIYWSPGAEALYGYAEEEILGQHVDTINLVDAENPWISLDEILGAGSWFGERKRRRQDGTLIHTETTLSPIYDANGEPIGVVSVDRDITKRRAIADALHKNQTLLRETQQLSKVGGWEYDVATGEITWTKETYEIYGVPPDEYDTNDISQNMDFYAPEAVPVLEEAFKQACDQGRPYDLDLEFIRANGERIWVRTIGKPEVRDGEVVRVTGNLMDITERKSAEEALRQSERRNEVLLAAMPDLFSRLTRDGIYLDFRPSPHWKPLFTAEEAIGRSIYDVLPKDLADRRLAYCRQVLDTGEPKLYEYELLEDGDIRHYESRIIVSGTDETLSVVRDVTERKRAEEALRQSERRNEVLLAAMPDLFARLTRDGIYLDFRPSPQWEALFTAEEAIGRSSYDLMPKELADRRLYYCHRALDTGEPQAYEYELVEEDETRHYETRVVVSGPDETLSVVRDITDRKHAEKELRLKNRAIETSLTPICIGDLEGVLTHVNSAFLKLWGYDHKEQVLGRVAQEFWQEPAEATAVIDALHRDGRWMGELVGKRADGSAFKTKVAATVIENERGEPESLMGSFMDVTTERRYQQALHQRTAELSALNALGMALCTCFSVGTVSQAALKHAMRLFDFAFGAVYLLDDTSDEFRLVTHKGLSKEEAAMLHRVRTRDQPFAHTQRMPESGVISLQDRPDSEWARCLHAMGVTRAVAVPLVSRDTIIGSLDLGGGTGLLSGQDISLLTTIGIQIGPNLESAKLFGELERAHRQLQGLSAQLTNTLEEERAHISRELHDEVGQALTALKLTLQIAQDNHQLEAKDGESAVLAPSIDLIDTTVDRVRQIAAGLRADTISDLGLLPALREQVEAFAKRSGIMIQLKMADSEPALSHEAKLALYRIVQEGLTNVAKHADADEVVIQLEEAPETIQVTIQDDGNGFAPFGFQDGRQEEHLGLVGVRERAELLGGRVRIQSKPNAGTSITVRLPKNHKEAKDDHDPGPTR